MEPEETVRELRYKIIDKPVEMFMKKLVCDCGKEMKRGKMLLSDPPKFEHICEDCNHTVITDVSYPALAYREMG